jgi:hypothetical protein
MQERRIPNGERGNLGAFRKCKQLGYRCQLDATAPTSYSIERSTTDCRRSQRLRSSFKGQNVLPISRDDEFHLLERVSRS